MTEEALETMELSAETMLELPLEAADDRAELRDDAEELKPLIAELPTESRLEKADCSAEMAELATEEREDVSVVAEVED